MASTAVIPCVIRPARREDIPAIKTLLDADDWDEYDETFLTCMIELDSRGWFVSQSEKGDVIGALAMVRISESITAGGVLIVRQNMRGRGVARAFKAEVERVVGESSVVVSANSVQLYNTRGFTHDFDIKYVRGRVDTLMTAIPDTAQANVSTYDDKQFADIDRYDKELCTCSRSAYLKRWVLGQARSVHVARSESGSLIGYGCTRILGGCSFIGPLYADSVDIYWSLLKRLLQDLKGTEDVDMFITSNNTHSQELYNSGCMKTIVSLYRMHRGDAVDVKLDRVFCLSHVGFTVI